MTNLLYILTDQSRIHCRFGQDELDEFLPEPPESPRSIMNTKYLLSILCFGIPLRYLRYISEVSKVFVPEEDLRFHIERIVGEWKDFNLLVSSELQLQLPCML